MAREKKEAALTPEERLQAALVPDWEWPYKLPGNWCWTTVGAINQYVGISADPTKAKNKTFELYSVPSSADNYPEIVLGADIGSTKQSVKKGDVLLCKINPRINRVWKVSKYTDHSLLASSEWIVIRNSGLISNYLMWCFRSPYFRGYMLSNVSGVGGSLMRAQPKFVQGYPVPVPPLPEQQRIVDRIESLFSKLDEAKEKAQAVVDSFETRKAAILHAFVNSRVLLIYGAAGTGKTTLIDMISTMLSGRRKLFLTKTHTALQNLQRRINNPGADASFVSINSFTKRVNLPDYDVIFVDECSTIDNRAMKVFLEKMRPDTFLVLAGDTYQIESIDFGNWFTYAKDIIKTKGSNVELVSTWRTKDPGLIELWNETRNKGALITEKLVIDGPFSENIGEGVLYSEIMDEVILCLNYDGKFGLNNMNSYFQNANTETAVVWRDWKYKVGDHILFNDTDRFSLLYNNLKGRIVQIELFDSRIRFTVDVEIPLTEQDCQNDGIEFIDIIDDVTRIRFDVFDFEEEMADEDRKKTIVPFQLAYAVSIHKAQGLEYRSVKVVIPSSNAEKITHGIFYTAITRAKEKLKIYWSSETMQEVVAGFSIDTSRQKSLAIIKEKLKQDKNT